MVTSGDNFCAMWTLYFVMLRVENPDVPIRSIYSYLLGDKFVTRVGNVVPGNQIHISRGRWAADRIASFVLYATRRWKFPSAQTKQINAIKDQLF